MKCVCKNIKCVCKSVNVVNKNKKRSAIYYKLQPTNLMFLAGLVRHKQVFTKRIRVKATVSNVIVWEIHFVFELQKTF